MATSVEDLKRWFQEGVEQKATHAIIVCDTFDWEDYPVYVKEGEDVKKKYLEYDGKNMQQVMEVYDLRKPMEEQLNPKIRVMNF